MERQAALTRTQSRRIDQLAIEQYEIPGIVLMENAGRGVVEVLLKIDSGLASSTHDAPPVAIFCGKGNNAGDGMVIARHLAIRGVASHVLLLCPAGELQGDALSNLKILQHCDVPLIELADDLTRCGNDATELFNKHAAGAKWLIDAMLGTGATGEPRPPMDAAIAWMNSQPARRLAVDIPSGLDCDTGQPAAATLRADVTCTLAAPKIGFQQPAAQPHLGQLHVVPIGTPPELLGRIEA